MPIDFNQVAEAIKHQGVSGPFFAVQIKASEDGVIPARSFYLRTKNKDDDKYVKQVVDISGGILLDLESLKTGWVDGSGSAKGVAPKKVWNDRIVQFKPKPGDDYKQMFAMYVGVIAKPGEALTRCYWEQGGPSMFNCFERLVALFKDGSNVSNFPKMPVIVPGKWETIPIGGQQGDLHFPLFKVERWAPMPEGMIEKVVEAGEELDDAIPF